MAAYSSAAALTKATGPGSCEVNVIIHPLDLRIFRNERSVARGALGPGTLAGERLHRGRRRSTDTPTASASEQSKHSQRDDSRTAQPRDVALDLERPPFARPSDAMGPFA